MHIHFQQAEKKSQVFSYMLIAVVVFTISMLILNASRTVDLHLSIPSLSSEQPVYGEISNMPVAIPAPLPPAEQVQVTAIPSSTPSPLPQAVPVHVPDLP